MMKIRTLARCALVTAAVTLTACSSSGPKTRFYSLFAESHAVQSTLNDENKDISYGIGPVSLPEFLDNPAIVSLTQSNQVRVSGSSAWAGDLDSAIVRVLADNISAKTNLESVWAFPWDSRARPKYQVRIAIEDFSGQLGGEVNLKAKWTMIDQEQSEVVKVGKEVFSVQTESESFDDYVAGLNKLINMFASSLAVKLNETH